MFGFHPANLALRFLLEVAALGSMVLGAFELTTGPLSWVLAVGVPLTAASAWGVFNVPGDPSRSGGAPIPVSGAMRLAIEVVFFALAVALVWPTRPTVAVWLGVIVAIHYLLSLDRVRWLLKGATGD